MQSWNIAKAFVFITINLLLSISSVSAAPFYTYQELGVTRGERLIFTDQGTIDPTPSYFSTYTHQSDGAYSIGRNLFSSGLDRGFSTAILSGHQPVAIPGRGESPNFAYSVNSTGTFVGASVQRAFDEFAMGTAFRFTIDGGYEALPMPYYSLLSGASGINEAGQIVGWGLFNGLTASEQGFKAFLFDGMTSWDLNNLIAPHEDFTIMKASDINDSGQILGESYNRLDGSTHLFLLIPTATPEPSTFLVLSIGVTACGVRSWKKRQSR